YNFVCNTRIGLPYSPLPSVCPAQFPVTFVQDGEDDSPLTPFLSSLIRKFLPGHAVLAKSLWPIMSFLPTFGNFPISHLFSSIPDFNCASVIFCEEKSP